MERKRKHTPVTPKGSADSAHDPGEEDYVRKVSSAGGDASGCGAKVARICKEVLRQDLHEFFTSH